MKIVGLNIVQSKPRATKKNNLNSIESNQLTIYVNLKNGVSIIVRTNKRLLLMT